MAFRAVAREEGRVMSRVVTTVVKTDVAFLARAKIDDQLVESMTTTNEHVLFSIMDVVASFYQSYKVTAGPGATVPTELK
jgi:hypothetical protein